MPWAALLAVSAILHFWRLSEPASIVFDEVWFGRYAAHYLDGSYYFDIHPPHLKLLYGLLAYISSMPEGFAFPQMGATYPSDFYLSMRFFAASCGTLLPLAVVWLALNFSAARLWAFCIGWLCLLDTALLTESRFILLNIPMLLLGVLGWASLSYWVVRKNRWSFWLGAFLIGLAVSTKWTGLGFLAPALIGVAWVNRSNLPQAFRSCFYLLLTAAAIYLAGYILHFYLLHLPGPGNAFMSSASQQILASRSSGLGLRISDYWSLTVDLHQSMSNYASKVAGHPYASHWFSWPWGWRGIYFWTDGVLDQPKKIYLLPNLVVWWSFALVALRFLLNLVPALLAGSDSDKTKFGQTDVLLALAWIVNFLPFVLVDRPMFLYHYFPALMVTAIIFAREMSTVRRSATWISLFVAGATCFFLWLAPLAYGLQLSNEGYETRMIFESWK